MEELKREIKEFKGSEMVLEDIKAKYLFADPSKECTGEGALLSVQIGCLQSEESLEKKSKVVLALVCIGVFACCAYYSGVYYILEVSHLQKLLWDLDTRTAGDYTVELNITDRQFDRFKEQVYEVNFRDPNNPVSEGAAFKKYLFQVIPEMLCDTHNAEIRSHIEQELLGSSRSSVDPLLHFASHQYSSRGYSSRGNTVVSNDQVQIQMIEFAYKNSELIQLLMQRGDAIVRADFKKVD